MAWSPGWGGPRTPSWVVRAVRARRYCEECRRDIGAAGHVDHIKNRAEGGGNELENFQLLCPGCHEIKTRAEQRRGRQRYAARSRYDPGGHPGRLDAASR